VWICIRHAPHMVCCLQARPIGMKAVIKHEWANAPFVFLSAETRTAAICLASHGMRVCGQIKERGRPRWMAWPPFPVDVVSSRTPPRP
jgi:hypothetical protein